LIIWIIHQGVEEICGRDEDFIRVRDRDSAAIRGFNETSIIANNFEVIEELFLRNFTTSSL
jgi:hypothetical protein